MTPEETIKRIAEIASAVAWQSGVGGMELAGQFVSILAAHPEWTEKFLKEGICAFDNGEWTKAELGCLSWRAVNGEITSPSQLRAHKSHPDS